MARSLLARAQNSAASSPTRARALEYVIKHATELEEAARSGVVPVSTISEGLSELLGSDLANPALKQYVGLCVVAVLEDRGYKVVRPRVRTKDDRNFGVGALFSREPARDPDGNPLLLRILETLSVPELMVAEEHIRRRLLSMSSTDKHNKSAS